MPAEVTHIDPCLPHIPSMTDLVELREAATENVEFERATETGKLVFIVGALALVMILTVKGFSSALKPEL